MKVVKITVKVDSAERRFLVDLEFPLVINFSSLFSLSSRFSGCPVGEGITPVVAMVDVVVVDAVVAMVDVVAVDAVVVSGIVVVVMYCSQLEILNEDSFANISTSQVLNSSSQTPYSRLSLISHKAKNVSLPTFSVSSKISYSVKSNEFGILEWVSRFCY